MISTSEQVSGNLRPKRVGRPRPTTDTRIAVDIRELFRHIGGNTGGRALYRWNRNSDQGGQVPVATVFALASPVLVKVTHVGGAMPEETLDVAYTPCRYGGRRAWFLCTKLGCGKRVAILYDHPRGFRCRHCCQLDYQSHRERSYDRMLRRSRRLRARVGGGVNLTETFPPRPKGMHWATYDQLLVAEARLWGKIRRPGVERPPSCKRCQIGNCGSRAQEPSVITEHGDERGLIESHVKQTLRSLGPFAKGSGNIAATW